MRAPGGRDWVRRPSHHSTPAALVPAMTLTASREVGATTIGPPAEKLYAVEPVGVAQTTPSQPHRDNGRPSISTTTSSIRSRDAFSTLASLSAHDVQTSRPPS